MEARQTWEVDSGLEVKRIAPLWKRRGVVDHGIISGGSGTYQPCLLRRRKTSINGSLEGVFFFSSFFSPSLLRDRFILN